MSFKAHQKQRPIRNRTTTDQSQSQSGIDCLPESKDASAALLATAFQDHFSKSLSLTPNRSCKGKVNHGLPVQKSQRVVAKVSTRMCKESRAANLKGKKRHEEYVIGSKVRDSTLAEKMGLVKGPDRRLTETDWKEAKSKSSKRGDFVQPCPICRELFGLSEQVLLSCTHVFHKVCLQSFERFSGKKVCPICRKEQYQARVVHEGAKHFRNLCAIRIQATWKGYIIRKWYKELRKRVPPNDPKLREQFFQAKFTKITDDVLESSETFHRNLDVFFEELDQNLQFSKLVMSQLTNKGSEEHMAFNWDQVQLKAVEREEVDCPICMMPLCNVEASETENESGCKKASYLLSCSHIFHVRCLESFEEFSISRSRLCPICRSSYHKKKCL